MAGELLASPFGRGGTTYVVTERAGTLTRCDITIPNIKENKQEDTQMTNMDKLYEAVEARGPVCVGLDTDFSYLPTDLWTAP